MYFFRAKNKISSARALGKATLGLALARTDALNLQGFSACKKKQGGMEGWRESNGRDWKGGETCLYFLGIRHQMSALRGGLRSRPPWTAGKLTPIWLCGLPCTLPACSPELGPRLLKLSTMQNVREPSEQYRGWILHSLRFAVLVGTWLKGVQQGKKHKQNEPS